MKTCHPLLIAAGVLCLGHALTADAATGAVLIDVDGFNSDTQYPVGRLQPIPDGHAQWQPAAQPAQILLLEDDPAHGKILRRTQTGQDHVDYLAVSADGSSAIPAAFRLVDPAFGGQAFGFSFQTQSNREYMVETGSLLTPPVWSPLDTRWGDGLLSRYTDPNATQSQQSYRVALLPPPGWSDGYRGIWFTLGQVSEYGDKYSGGLGTYTANHVPMAIHAPAVNKTFFVYGGTIRDQRHLLIMASYYDHSTRQVPRPTVVHDKGGVNDPHDNPSLCLDPEGYLWVFVSGRGRVRPGFKYRSKRPYDVSEFDRIRSDEITYPQPWHIAGHGFLHLFTKYTAGRELYWETSPDGVAWSPHRKLAGIQGHYQVSQARQQKIGTFFNRHPNGNVDQRTDLYYLQTEDFGQTWTTADGTPVPTPLTTPDNPARVINYAAQGRLMYTMDLDFDDQGHPVLLYITSRHYAPGPAGDPRTWTLTRWDGHRWITSTICQSDHNYDMGSLYLRPNRWLVIGPTQTGPQAWQAGGEMALWTSADRGLTWVQSRQITRNSAFNHTYARRPLHAADPFFAFWADGDPTAVSPSRLYFTDSTGSRVWQLPDPMTNALQNPIELPLTP